MKSIYTKIRKYLLVLIVATLFSSSSSGQFYEWAFTPGFVSHGATGSFRSTDMHGNAYFFSYEIPCMACDRLNIRSYSPSGQENWSLTNLSLPIPSVYNLYAIDADSSKNRYVLIEFGAFSLPFQLGIFTINDPYCMVKFDSSGVAVRVTVLPEKYTQIKTDSVGNAFISTGTTVRRYNKFGNLSWEYLAGFNHQLYLDYYKNSYLVNNDIAVKLNPSGTLKYSKTESGGKTVDIWGRLYVSTSCGLKRYTKSGIFQWIRPGISGEIQVNRNGNIYAFRNDSIFKYNHIGTILQWTFDAVPSPGIVSLLGDVYLGGTYNPLTTDLQLCPFRLPSVGQFVPVNSSQLWVAKLNGKDPLPFQAAVYTEFVSNQYGWVDVNFLCTSIPLSIGFSYCTNAASSFAPGNQFSIEVSDDQGNFANAINIGSPTTGIIPDSLPYGTAYRLRVVSTTPGVSYYPNLPYLYSSDVSIQPNKADLSLSGTQNICQGATLQLSVATSDSNGHIDWYNSGNVIPGAQDLPSISIDSMGNYYASVTNNYCFRQTDTVIVNVNPRPDPVISPVGPISFCQGDSAVLNVVDVDLSLIKWRLNGTNIPGANDTTLSVYAAGAYAVRVFNQYGCARTSSPVDVSVPCRVGQPNNIQTGIDIIIYPNPTSGDSEWSFMGIDPDQYVVTITDLTGREVFHQFIHLDEATTIAIQSSDLSPGTYYAKITGQNQNVSRLMVITE